MRRVRWAALAVLVAAAWREAAGEPPPQGMASEERFHELRRIAQTARLRPAAAQPAPRLDLEAINPVDEKALREALDRLSRGFFLPGRSNVLEDEVEVDTFLLPNLPLTRMTVRWDSATDAQGRQLLRRGAAAEALDVRKARCGVPLASRADENAVRQARGRVAVETPATFEARVVGCGAAGQRERAGDVELALERCDRDVFSLIVSGLDDADRVQPLDDKGRPLVLRELRREPLYGGARIEEVRYAQFRKGPDAARLVEGRAEGVVAAVRWLRPGPPRRFTLDVTALPAPRREDYGPRSPVRYEAPAEELPPAVVDEQRLAPVLRSRRACSGVDFNVPQIELALPAVENSRYADVSVARWEAVGGRAGLELKPQPGRSAPDRRLFRLYRSRGRNLVDQLQPSDENLEAERLLVTMSVRYPLRVLTRTAAASDPSVRFEGNRVTLLLARGESLAVARDDDGLCVLPSPSAPTPMRAGMLDAAVTAFDAAGLPLHHLPAGTQAGDELHFAFAGKVARVAWRVATDWVERTVSADLAPAPRWSEEMVDGCR